MVLLWLECEYAVFQSTQRFPSFVEEIYQFCGPARPSSAAQPRLARGSRAAPGSTGVADRCRLFAGDFFESVPAGADAYLLKHVLHDWDDEPATAILRSVRRAMPSKSTLLLVEGMLPDEAGAADAPMLLIDVLMLVVTGGRERTEAEFAALLADAGFESARRSEALPPFDYRVIEATPV
jgi:hypothetical protein